MKSLPVPLNVFDYCARSLSADLANPPGGQRLSAEQLDLGRQRVKLLSRIGQDLDVRSNDPALASALGRAAIDWQAREQMLAGLLALEAWMYDANGNKAAALKIRHIAESIEELYE